jgi:hypothetical protein
MPLIIRSPGPWRVRHVDADVAHTMEAPIQVSTGVRIHIGKGGNTISE